MAHFVPASVHFFAPPSMRNGPKTGFPSRRTMYSSTPTPPFQVSVASPFAFAPATARSSRLAGRRRSARTRACRSRRPSRRAARRRLQRRLGRLPAPDLQDFRRVGQSAAAEPAAADGHHALSDDRVGERLGVVRPERLKAQSTGMVAAAPLFGPPTSLCSNPSPWMMASCRHAPSSQTFHEMCPGARRATRRCSRRESDRRTDRRLRS